MAVLTITTCPHCGAEMEAFHHTRWETMESRTDVEPEFCPGCGKPLDPERTAWQQAAGSGTLRDDATTLLKVIAASAVAVVIAGFAVSFYTSGYTLYGVVALALLAAFALVLASHRMGRTAKEPPLVRFELLPHGPGRVPAPPLWDTQLVEGIRAIVPPPREKKTDSKGPTSARKPPAPSTEEIAHRVARAWLEPEVDHPIRRHVRVIAERTTQWPAMHPAEADRKFGMPVAVGSNGTRAYVTIRRNGRGTLSLLQPSGTERVLRFELKVRKRRA
jgi:hypothetical protein